MGIVLRKKLSVFMTEILLILCISLSFAQNSDVTTNFRDSTDQDKDIRVVEPITTLRVLSSQVPINDTIPPRITFIQPNPTNILIVSKTYEIIVNITDDSPPLQGDVIIRVSNHSTFLFNGSMTLTGNSLWSFNWNNLTSYPNQENYTLRVWAKDSSPYKNSEWSEEYFIFVSIQSSPGFLQIILFILIIIFTSFIFAGVTVYFNKKNLRESGKKKRKRTKGVIDD